MCLDWPSRSFGVWPPDHLIFISHIPQAEAFTLAQSSMPRTTCSCRPALCCTCLLFSQANET